MNERQHPIFEAQGVTGDRQLEIPYGPWLLWGQPQLSYVKANPMPADRGDVYYEGWVRLSRTPFGKSGPFVTDAASFSNGDTPIVLPDGYDFAGAIGGAGPAFTFEKDKNGNLSHLHFPHINAPSIEVALNGVEQLATQIVWGLTVSANQPLFYDGILIKSMDSAEFRAHTRAATPQAGLASPDPMYLHPSLRPFVSQYVEGVRSSSPFYSFLCYFKVCERMNDVRSKLRKVFNKRGIDAPPLNGTFPEDPVAHVSLEMVGVKYTAAVTKYQALYRNGIAHFNPADRLEPLVELQNEGAVRTAGIVMRWAAFDLINQVSQALVGLQTAGVNLEDVDFG